MKQKLIVVANTRNGLGYRTAKNNRKDEQQ